MQQRKRKTPKNSLSRHRDQTTKEAPVMEGVRRYQRGKDK